MKISLEKLLGKMEEELQAAKASQSESQLRERVHAVKALCELILDEPSTSITQPQSLSTRLPKEEHLPAIQPRKLRIDDDEANGDSLLDF